MYTNTHTHTHARSHTHTHARSHTHTHTHTRRLQYTPRLLSVHATQTRSTSRQYNSQMHAHVYIQTCYYIISIYIYASSSILFPRRSAYTHTHALTHSHSPSYTHRRLITRAVKALQSALILPTTRERRRAQVYTVWGLDEPVGRFSLAVRRQASKRKDLGSIPLRLYFLFENIVVCGRCLVTLSITINE